MLIRDERLVEFFLRKVGPERVAEVELTVRALPQKVIADALLPAGADEKIGIGQAV